MTKSDEKAEVPAKLEEGQTVRRLSDDKLGVVQGKPKGKTVDVEFTDAAGTVVAQVDKSDLEPAS